MNELTLEQKQIAIEHFNSIKVSAYALGRYRRYVRGNSEESDEVLTNKLKRNLVAATYGKTSNKGVDTFYYGNLKIYVRDNVITSIYNINSNDNETVPMKDSIDFEIRDFLNEYIDIISIEKRVA